VLEVSAIDTVDELAADGLEAAFLYDGYAVGAWNAGSGRRRRVGGADTGVADLTMAGGTVAYTYFEDTSDLHYAAVTTSSGFESPHAGLACRRTCVGWVAGHGGLIVYDTWRTNAQGGREILLMRIVGRRAFPIARGAGALYAAAVARGRIVVRDPAGTAALLSADGIVLRRYRFGRPVRSIRFDGESVVARLGGTTGPQSIVVLDAARGAVIRRWAVARGTHLEDVSNGVVVYDIGRQIHLRRLVDGRDVVVPLPAGALAPVHAQLEPSGIFFSWSVKSTDPAFPDTFAGRLGFAPLARVTSLFAR
jgi:hypothetical protein